MRKIEEFKAGDTVSVYQKGQPPFSGIVIARHGGNSPSATFIVRAILSGIGVEKIYPLHSPLITKIEIKKRGKVRGAKLYYLRGKIGKEAKIAQKEEKRKKIKTEQKAKGSETKIRDRVKK